MNDITNRDIISGLVVAIGGLLSLVFGLFTKNHSDKIKAIEADIADQEDHCEKCKANIMTAIKDANSELVTTFREGLENERNYRLGIMTAQGADIKRIFERVDEISIAITRVEEKQNESIKHQAEICRLRHEEE